MSRVSEDMEFIISISTVSVYRYFIYIIFVFLCSCTSIDKRTNNKPTEDSSIHISESINRERIKGLKSYISKDERFILSNNAEFSIYQSAMKKLVIKNMINKDSTVLCTDINTCNGIEAIRRFESFYLQSMLLKMLSKASETPAKNKYIKIEFKPLLPVEQRSECQGVEWGDVQHDSVQLIPICKDINGFGYKPYRFDIMVTNISTKDLRIFALALPSDGCVIGFTPKVNYQILNPSSTIKLARLSSTLPLNRIDRIAVFAQTAEVQFPDIDSYNSCDYSNVASNRKIESWIHKQIESDLFMFDMPAKNSMRTFVFTRLKTVTNRPFQLTSQGVSPRSAREYTINNFDIRPYMPDNKSTSLYKVLYQAHKLTGDAYQDGIGYKQHDWCATSDRQNLLNGIDCSRAIWFVFSRASLPYTTKNYHLLNNTHLYNIQPYIPTVSMVSKNSLLANNFDRCDGQELQLGDVLVYRRTDKEAGHVVMVIDPEQRIAWGSHGWDGNGLTPDGVPDNGAEYQLLKRKKDWRVWDRRTMILKACWRHRDFTAVDPHDIGDVATKTCSMNLINCAPD